MNGLPQDGVDLAITYRTFATREAAGHCAIYETLCLGVAGDPELLARIGTLPLPKRQPNLLLASARWHGGPMDSYPRFRAWVLENWEQVATTMAQRRTQTNEAARMDTIQPVLATLPQPLALLEVGASAGLCLYPDDPNVEVVWRAGIDLNPLSVANPDDVRWLECLVWPSQPHRLQRLRQAVEIARRNPPLLVQGDLNHDLDPLVEQAPKDATLVVFHTAVLAYVQPAQRVAFAAKMHALHGHWVSNEAPGVINDVVAPPGLNVLALDGTPVAFTGPHGQVFQWI
ncbi:DUF2332 domain-containing protein [Rhizocola hellebori]|nr:DUF2332 domain-containing protein [Rhizocola hellebori]